jgi:hypothetical protein
MKKQTLTLLLILAAGVGFSQREIPTLKPQPSIAMPAPVFKTVASEKRQTQRIYYTLKGDTYFWDCDKITKIDGGYLVITTLGSGNTKERFVSDSAKITINKLR